MISAIGFANLGSSKRNSAFRAAGSGGPARETTLHFVSRWPKSAATPAAGTCGDVDALVERFDRRGTEPFELFRSEFGQNSWNPEKTMKSHSIEAAAHKAEKATNDPLYEEGPQKIIPSELRKFC